MTGASSGIGAGIVRLLSAQGAKVVATARRADKIERLDGVTAVAADVTRSDDLERVAALGPVDILVNCAGGSRPTTPELGRGRLGRGLRAQLHRRPQADDGAAPGDARAQMGPHRQHQRLDGAARPQCRHRRQGRAASLGQGPVVRYRRRRGHVEHDPARPHRQRADPREASSRPRNRGAASSSATSRSATSASRRTSPTSQPSSPRPPRATSPAPSSRSTAACTTSRTDLRGCNEIIATIHDGAHVRQSCHPERSASALRTDHELVMVQGGVLVPSRIAACPLTRFARSRGWHRSRTFAHFGEP